MSVQQKALDKVQELVACLAMHAFVAWLFVGPVMFCCASIRPICPRLRFVAFWGCWVHMLVLLVRPFGRVLVFCMLWSWVFHLLSLWRVGFACHGFVWMSVSGKSLRHASPMRSC